MNVCVTTCLKINVTFILFLIWQWKFNVPQCSYINLKTKMALEYFSDNFLSLLRLLNIWNSHTSKQPSDTTYHSDSGELTHIKDVAGPIRITGRKKCCKTYKVFKVVVVHIYHVFFVISSICFILNKEPHTSCVSHTLKSKDLFYSNNNTSSRWSTTKWCWTNR